MNYMRRMYTWFVEHPKAFFVLMGAIAATVFWWLLRARPGMSLGDAIELRTETKAIAQKEGQAMELVRQGNAKAMEVKTLEAEIIASKRRVVEIQTSLTLEGKSDEEVAKIFTDAGF